MSTMSTDLPKGLVPIDSPATLPEEAGQLAPVQLLSILFADVTFVGIFIC